jgi:hypothetical protein
MFTLLTVIRKKPNITTEEFRHFMRYEYGPRARSPLWAIWHGHYPSWSRRRVR